jgi:hypothetical protein
VQVDGPKVLNYKESRELGDLLTYTAKVITGVHAKFISDVPKYWKYKIALNDCGERTALIWHI